jgi:DNA-binding MarR family transcriptional regulator/GNAT superfamily N-acetyltransferase
MDFYDRIGTASLGSRLRRLGDRLAEDAKPIYAMYGMQLQPRWFPVIYLLANEGKHSVTAIADEIGQTHASVSQIVGEMVKQGYARLSKGTSDGRKTFVSLSAKGLGAARKLNPQLIDAAAAVEDMQAEVGVDLWNTLVAIEQALDRQNLHRRLLRQKIKREGNVTIVDYLPRHAKAFRTLNEDWINTYFKMEEADRRALNDPEGTFLQPGGFILMAVSGSKPVGACALLPHGEGCFELAKMAVARTARGKGIGWLLGEAAIGKARSAGARKLYLESNTCLESAIGLYRKLGFTEITDAAPSPYERCNIQMELALV